MAIASKINIDIDSAAFAAFQDKFDKGLVLGWREFPALACLALSARLAPRSIRSP
jgi:hypothetical protein